MYEKNIRFLGIIKRGTKRFNEIERTYHNELAASVKLTEALYPIETAKARESMKFNNRSPFINLARAYEKEGIVGFPILKKLKSVRSRLDAWELRRKQIFASLSVRLDDKFTIKPISYGRKGVMVSISHPALKTNVTRHLRRNGNRFTGNAPFGIDAFIEYQVFSLLAKKSIHLTGKKVA